MTRRGTIIQAIIACVGVAGAAVLANRIDRELDSRSFADANAHLSSISALAESGIIKALDSNDTSRLTTLLKGLAADRTVDSVSLQYPSGPRLEIENHTNDKSLAVTPGAQRVSLSREIGAAETGPARGVLTMTGGADSILAGTRTLALYIALPGLLMALSAGALTVRMSHHRVVARVLERLTTIRTSQGKTRGKHRFSPRIEAELKVLSTAISSMSSYKEFFTNALQSMVDSLIIVNADGGMLAVNQAAVDTLGYTEEQLLGKNVSMIWADSSGFLLSGERLKNILADGARNDLELTFRTKEGNAVPMNLSGSAIRSKAGEITGYVCIATNIADRKKAEEEKERLNKELVDTSRRAGMAEVATGVLHNVGNVLNSVTVTASSISSLVHASRVPRLTQVADLIREHDDDLGSFLTSDPKGTKIPEYVCSLADVLGKERDSMLAELDELGKNIEHIKTVIGVQQRVARVSGVAEEVEPAELMEDAIRIRESSFGKHGIRIHRSFTLVRPITTDKHKVLQILVNLVGNALDAMTASESKRRILSLSIIRSTDDKDFVEIEVSDTGPGIPPENLTRIFNHGFTTKKKGHGFGLHSAAIAARELGGSLTARNRENGTGANFLLRLPIEAREEARETEAAK